MAKTFYISAPDSDGLFSAANTVTSDEYKEGVSLFRFIQRNDNIAEFGLSKKEAAIKQAMENPNFFFASKAINAGNAGKVIGITVLEPGVTELQPNGDRKVTKKSVVRIEYKEEPPTEPAEAEIAATEPAVTEEPASVEATEPEDETSNITISGGSGKNKTLLIIFSIFLGWMAVDRFYAERTRLGIAKIITMFFCVGIVWWLIDVILAINGKQKDKDGYYID